MDEAVIRYYRKLINEGFRFAGTVENPTIALDAASENVRICDHVGTDSLQLYLSLRDGVVETVRYLCMCDPTTNVAVEIFCSLIEGRQLSEVDKLTPESFSSVIGGESQELLRKARGLLDLVLKGIARHLATGLH